MQRATGSLSTTTKTGGFGSLSRIIPLRESLHISWQIRPARDNLLFNRLSFRQIACTTRNEMTDREDTTYTVTGGSLETAGAEAVGSHSGRRSTRENVWTARMARLLLQHRSVLYSLLCCAAVLICIALAHPFANSAFNDDWAYSRVALKLAETGR